MTMIRNAVRADIATILDLFCELGRPDPQNTQEANRFKEIILEYIADANKALFVAESDEKVVGVASIILLTRCNRAKPEMYIPELIVEKNYRGSGIGKSLITHCIKTAKQAGCHRIRLESGNQRNTSHDFYQHLGFNQSAMSFDIAIS